MSIAWHEPLALANHFRDEPHVFLLYSGRKEAHTGRYSYLGIGALQTKEFDAFSEMPEHGNWFGYLSYAMRHAVEHYNPSSPTIIDLPAARFTKPEHLFIFDHDSKTLTYHGTNIPNLPKTLGLAEVAPCPTINGLCSNFTDHAYISAIEATIKRIEAGDFYQANLTRKYWGDISGAHHFDVFLRLCEVSPAPYSAFLKWNGTSIISSSPECFLSIDGNNTITARPIKGSAGRSDNADDDARIVKALLESPKDHAENLMIVDLLRNDLARVSEAGSVRVTEQSGLYSYATIHHLISTIESKLQDSFTRTDALKACFPPGSMTGAPKIAAIEWCNTHEKRERGIYSGAIGWLGENNQCDFSVVIRTIIIKDNQFEFQVGGGIVADSSPAKELEETRIKARGICKALGIELTQLQQ
ncbi:MAG: anthranilate synthase component I family protein [Alphaproteobacteria bacterium]|nr:anthranilate synthase component I family protein [Alphaproteobacteria bacterium]